MSLAWEEGRNPFISFTSSTFNFHSQFHFFIQFNFDSLPFFISHCSSLFLFSTPKRLQASIIKCSDIRAIFVRNSVGKNVKGHKISGESSKSNQGAASGYKYQKHGKNRKEKQIKSVPTKKDQNKNLVSLYFTVFQKVITFLFTISSSSLSSSGWSNKEWHLLQGIENTRMMMTLSGRDYYMEQEMKERYGDTRVCVQDTVDKTIW